MGPFLREFISQRPVAHEFVSVEEYFCLYQWLARHQQDPVPHGDLMIFRTFSVFVSFCARKDSRWADTHTQGVLPNICKGIVHLEINRELQ